MVETSFRRQREEFLLEFLIAESARGSDEETARYRHVSPAARGAGWHLGEADRTNNRSKRDGCEVRLIDGALGGSLRRRPLSPLRMWRWTLETEGSRETAVTWVAVAAWRQAVVFYGSLSWYRAAGSSVLSGGALAWVVVAASRSTNVLEDRGDDIGIFDAGDDAQFAAALGAGLDVDGEDAFQALHPGHGGKGPDPAFRGEVCVLARRTRDACNSARTRRGTG